MKSYTFLTVEQAIVIKIIKIVIIIIIIVTDNNRVLSYLLEFQNWSKESSSKIVLSNYKIVKN